ncbi:hypothetical protein ACFQ7F_41875, partial [Streptomyces sp. NPDC056486]|uniref:hypothetical protein n=1 Tax=Streptomyces sp. NPDC056486 TaxID=3345835 RepID=UPI0036B4AB6D
KPTRSYAEERTNPVTGKKETATVTEYPDTVKHGDRDGSDKPTRSYAEERTNPVTGKKETATVTEYPDTVKRPSSQGITGLPSGMTAPAPGTGGLYLRDAGGAVKGLMTERDRARIIACHPSDRGLVRVQQTTSGSGGWGAYIGYVKIAATVAPHRIACG